MYQGCTNLFSIFVILENNINSVTTVARWFLSQTCPSTVTTFMANTAEHSWQMKSLKSHSVSILKSTERIQVMLPHYWQRVSSRDPLIRKSTSWTRMVLKKKVHLSKKMKCLNLRLKSRTHHSLWSVATLIPKLSMLLKIGNNRNAVAIHRSIQRA